MPGPSQHPPVRTFKPRRRALTPARAVTVERLAQRWALDEAGARLDLPAVFGRDVAVVLEIGIGLGDTMIAMARAQPELDVIGVDVHTPGFATALARIDELGLTNVRVVHGDALEFVDRLGAGALSGVRVFFPDPWPKIRQRHRRLVRDDVVARLVGLVRPGGWFHLATDIGDYAEQMQRVCDAHPALRGGVIDRPSWRPVTRYEQRGLDLGHTAVDLWYSRDGLVG
jgi:tRNA (guanine-N7-)-methyltransferase